MVLFCLDNAGNRMGGTTGWGRKLPNPVGTKKWLQANSEQKRKKENNWAMTRQVLEGLII